MGATSCPQPPLRRAVEGNRLLIPGRLGKIGRTQDWAFIAEAQPPLAGVIQMVGEDIDPVAVAVMHRDQDGRSPARIGVPSPAVQEHHPSKG